MVQAVDSTNSHFKRLFKLIGNTWSYVICPPLGIKDIELYPDHVFLVTPYVFVLVTVATGRQPIVVVRWSIHNKRLQTNGNPFEIASLLLDYTRRR